MPSFWRRNGLLICALVAITAGVHLLFLLSGVTPKLYPFAATFQAMEQGQAWPLGTMLSISSLKLGGPLYYWLHYPLTYFGLPFQAVHLYYGALEVATLLLWLALGRRHFEEDLVLWTGLLLAVNPFTKSEIGESSLFLMALPVLIFLTQLRALASTRTAPFILPALLWGVALQLHLSALFIAPAMVLSIWFAGGRRGARLLLVAGTFLTSGVIPTFLPALFQIEELQSLAPLSRAVVGGRHWAVLLASFSTILVINLFALIGLIRITRRRGWSARGVLVWFWFTVPLAAVLLMDPDDFKPWHYAILSPAFALLSGVGLRSIFRWLRRRPWIPDRLASALGVGGCTAALLALLVPAFLFQEGALAADFPGGAAGACSVWRQLQRPEAFGDILDQIKARIAPGSGERARFTGLSHDHLSGGLWCETRAARLDFWSPRREPGDLEGDLGFHLKALRLRSGGAQPAADPPGEMQPLGPLRGPVHLRPGGGAAWERALQGGAGA